MKKVFFCVMSLAVLSLGACKKTEKSVDGENEATVELTEEQKMDAAMIQKMKDAKAGYEQAKGTPQEDAAIQTIKDVMFEATGHYSDIQHLGDTTRIKAFAEEYTKLNDEFAEIARTAGIK